MSDFEFGPLQTQWLKALESGKYAQGTHCLKADNKYCCLGIVCELAGLAHDGHQHFISHQGEHGVHLPDYLAEQYGFFTNYGEADGGLSDSLVARNDGGSSFGEIATFIRANPKSVFKKAA